MDSESKFWLGVIICATIAFTTLCVGISYYETTVSKAAIEHGLHQDSGGRWVK